MLSLLLIIDYDVKLAPHIYFKSGLKICDLHMKCLLYVVKSTITQVKLKRKK